MRPYPVVAAFAAAALLLAACTDTGDGSAPSAAPASPVEVAPSPSPSPPPAPVATPSPPGAVLPPPQPASFDLAPPAASGDDTSVLDRLPSLEGEQLRVLGPETGADAEVFEAVLAPFEAATGATVVYEGTEDDTTVLAEGLAAGTPPDVAVVAQPGRLLDLAVGGQVLPLPTSLVATVERDFDPEWSRLVRARGRTWGVPNRASVKSLVWFNPGVFAAFGYEVPTTWRQLEELVDTMRAQDNVPWCLGISSGDATGWPVTDWLEDVVLRMHGAEVYDQWVAGEVGFDDPRIAAAADVVGALWFEEGNVLGGRSAIASTPFADAGLPLLDGDCLLHRQASFHAATLREAGATIAPDGDAWVFHLPPMADGPPLPVLSAGNFVAALTDRPATYALLAYVASPEYAQRRAAASGGGFLSPNRRQDVASLPTAFDREAVDLLVRGDPLRFDGSDLMPASVGAGEFWRAATVWVTGSIGTQDFLDRTEAAWPRG